MKHSSKITAILLMFFLCAQFIGLFVINKYIDYDSLKETGKVDFKPLPMGLESPQTAGAESLITIIFAVLIGTALALLLIKFRAGMLWRLWFLFAVFVTLSVAFNSFMPVTMAITLAVIFAFSKVFLRDFYVHNFTELFIYGGLAAIFINMIDFYVAAVLLLLISAYDAYAVWKSKHMIALAKFQTNSKLFAGIVIPYKAGEVVKTDHKKIKKVKVRTAILGGGDIGFPLLFSGAVFKELILNNSVLVSFAKISVIPLFTTLALGWLLYKADKDKFYPAMPFISAGCFAGFFVMKLIGFI
ncbi:hypothetical protein JXB27_00530 [Candidatus Woesearchaeota archaeon]|nr:hypothetical protein [Candidatus Woesearchaeota archaeon]